GATLALTGAIDGSDKIWPVVFNHFPRGFRHGPFDGAAADARLAARLAAIPAIRRVAAAGAPADWTRASGGFAVDVNALGVTEVAFELTGDACLFHLTDAGGRHS